MLWSVRVRVKAASALPAASRRVAPQKSAAQAAMSNPNRKGGATARTLAFGMFPRLDRVVLSHRVALEEWFQPDPFDHRIGRNDRQNGDGTDDPGNQPCSHAGDQHRKGRELEPIAVHLRYDEVILDQVIGDIKQCDEPRSRWRYRSREQ